LYSDQCPNYAEAYALKYVVVTSPTPTTTTVVTSTPEVVSTTGDSTVDAVIKTETTSTTSATATVQLAPTTSSSTATSTTIVAATTEAKTDDTTKNDTAKEEPKQDTSTASSTKSDGGSGSGTKETKTARQELAERRREAAKQAAVKAGKEAAESMTTATSMESQIAVQNVVIAAMGYTPGFNAYSFIMPDGVGYKPFEIYKKQRNVDNARLVRGLTGASDALHEQMVNAQYTRN
jgi:hypothetical protein